MSFISEQFLPYGRHCIDESDVQAVVDVLRGEWLTSGPAVTEFENLFAEKVGARYAVACSSGTAALHLCSLALGLDSGDCAIVPTMTFLATANAIRYVGGEVSFSDVDPATGLMGEADLAAALDRARERRVRSVTAVHLNGQCANMEAIFKLARAAGLYVVEDACHALGASILEPEGGPWPVGSCRWSDVSVFSLHPVKAVAMGEGGVVTTNDEALAERLRRLRSHGMTRESTDMQHIGTAFDSAGELNPWYYEMHELGFNYRASDIQCVLGKSQLGKLDTFVARRRELADCYDRLLAPLDAVLKPLPHVAWCSPAWHVYAVQIDFEHASVPRSELMRALRERGIGTQVHYIPVHTQPYFEQRYGILALPGAQRYYDGALSLPLFVRMTEHDCERVVEALADLLTRGEYS